MIPKKVGMDYIKVILLANIGLTFTYIVKRSNYKYDEMNIKIKNFPYYEHQKHSNYKIRVVNEEMISKLSIPDKINVPHYVYPTHYKVQLTVDTKSSYPIISVSGQIDISITIMPNFTMKTLFLNVKHIRLDNIHTKLYNNEEVYFVDKSYILYEEFLAIKFTSDVPHGNYTLKAVYHSTADNSFIRYELPQEYKLIGHKNDLILTNFRKTAARELFPCWDDPAYKTTFDIEVTHEDEYTALSNMPELETCENNDVHNFMKCTKFITTPTMSTHQLVILLEPKITVEPRENVHTWRKTDRLVITSFIHSTVNNIAEFLRMYTEFFLDTEKINHVLIPNVPYSKAELGLIIYRESDVIYNENKDLLNVKSEVMSMIELQVARQWFGGVITIYSWEDLWLTESFALYFVYYIRIRRKSYDVWSLKDGCEGERYDKTVLLNTVEKYNDILRMDDGSMPPISSEYLLLNEPPLAVYHKGALILRMLSGMLKECKFLDVVINYINKYKFGAESINGDLCGNLQTVMYNKVYITDNFQYKLTLIEVLKSWIMEKGYPIVNVIVDREHSKITFTQHSSTNKFIDHNTEYSKWWIPITYIGLDPNACHAYDFIWLQPNKILQINLDEHVDKNSWIIVNLGQTGYYRVRYERENWEKLGDFLNNGYYKGIPVINRAQLINDICDEYINQRTDWNLFEQVTSYLIRESEYAPWVSMLKCLDMLAEFFKFPESKWFKIHIANYFNNIIHHEIGDEKNPISSDDLTERMRQNLAFHACTLGNPTCIEIAVDKLSKWIRDSVKYEILPQWENWTFCFGLKTNEAPFFFTWTDLYVDYMHNIYTKKKTILYSLPCIEDPDIIIKFLHRIIEGITIIIQVSERAYRTFPDDDVIIGEAEQANLFNIIIKRHIGNNQIFSHIVDNIKTLKPKSISLTNAYDIIITNIYSEEQLDSLYESILIATDVSNKQEIMQHIEYQREKIKALKRKVDIMFPNEVQSTYYDITDPYAIKKINI